MTHYHQNQHYHGDNTICMLATAAVNGTLARLDELQIRVHSYYPDQDYICIHKNKNVDCNLTHRMINLPPKSAIEFSCLHECFDPEIIDAGSKQIIKFIKLKLNSNQCGTVCEQCDTDTILKLEAVHGLRTGAHAWSETADATKAIADSASTMSDNNNNDCHCAKDCLGKNADV